MTAPLLSLWERAAKGWRKMTTRKRKTARRVYAARERDMTTGTRIGASLERLF